jgi:hypothetical protein
MRPLVVGLQVGQAGLAAGAVELGLLAPVAAAVVVCVWGVAAAVEAVDVATVVAGGLGVVAVGWLAVAAGGTVTFVTLAVVGAGGRLRSWTGIIS